MREPVLPSMRDGEMTVVHQVAANKHAHLCTPRRGLSCPVSVCPILPREGPGRPRPPPRGSARVEQHAPARHARRSVVMTTDTALHAADAIFLAEQSVGSASRVVNAMHPRSAERRVGKECDSTRMTRWAPYH